MKHFSTALALLTGLLLTACGAPESTPQSPDELRQELATSRLIAVCLDGVQYWYPTPYKETVLTPRYSAETREVKLCPSGVVPVEDQPYIANQ